MKGTNQGLFRTAVCQAVHSNHCQFMPVDAQLWYAENSSRSNTPTLLHAATVQTASNYTSKQCKAGLLPVLQAVAVEQHVVLITHQQTCLQTCEQKLLRVNCAYSLRLAGREISPI